MSGAGSHACPAGPPAAVRLDELVEASLRGDRRALPRLITRLESDPSAGPAVMARAFPLCGRARTIGVTGPPGAGKSTLVNVLAERCRGSGRTVGVVAVDPSSPSSGGALLGDRLRMPGLGADPGVFIRSMASRGQPGGLSPAAKDVVRLLDAAGFEIVLVETVGVGQGETDVADLVQTVVVVLAPDGGDEIQAQKAGVLEIADVLLVNKSDRGQTGLLAEELRLMAGMTPPAAFPPAPWPVPVIEVSALRGTGLVELSAACEAHWRWLRRGGNLARRQARQAEGELSLLVGRLAAERFATGARAQEGWSAAVADVAARRRDPYAAALSLLRSSAASG